MSVPLKSGLSAAGITSDSFEAPCYPDFTPLDISLKNCLHPRLSLTVDGVSEFSFSGLYLFRNKYNYKISRGNGGFIISGSADEKTFFMTPCAAPDQEILEDLFKNHDYWKNIPESVLSPVMEKLQERGVVFEEDRNNFDYLYYREELAELSGKKFHKKKNHVNNFLSSYPNHEQKPVNKETIPAALEILDRWLKDKSFQSEGDYRAAKEALDLFDSLPLRGSIFYINGKPASFCLGESIARGRMFVIHFEKAIDDYKGIYQFMNQAFAASLPRFFTLLNREQDLGSEGMRQAKMTYRPCGFVKKYTGRLT
jgi:hypothetical protein